MTNNNNYGSDLHRKGELNKVDAMEKLANKITTQSRNKLASAFVTEGYQGYDAFCIIANVAGYQNKEGFVIFNEDTQRAEFIQSDEE